jgi:integrase/recombinase XerD
MARNKKAPGHFERRGRSWRWRVCVGGVYYRFTIGTPERTEAERWARQKYPELERQHGRIADNLPVNVRFSSLLDYFEGQKLPRLAPGTQEAYRDSLKPIRTYFVDVQRDPTLERMRRAHVAAFLDWRRLHRLDGEKPLHNRTLAKDRAVLHRLFEVGIEQEWCDDNPVRKTQVEKGDTRQPIILTPDEYEALLTECRDPMLRLHVLLNGETGGRCESEILWLRWEDVDLEGGFLTMVSGRDGHRVKGGKIRHVPLTARLRLALRQHFASYRFSGSPWVLHHTRTQRHHHAGDRILSLYDAWKSAAKRAKLPVGWVMHHLRHRRATTWLAEGKSAVLVKEALGHADLRTTMGYTHLVREHLRALVEDPGQKVGIAAQQ